MASPTNRKHLRVLSARNITPRIRSNGVAWFAPMVIIFLLLNGACAPRSSETTTPLVILETTSLAPTTTGLIQHTPTGSPTSVATKTPYLSPTSIPTSVATKTPHLIPTSIPTPPGIDLPFPILVLSENQRGVWLLDPQAVTLQRVTPSEWRVTAFDVSPVDGHMAFGSEDGELILTLLGDVSRIVLDVRAAAELPLYIRDVAWSPDGQRLAYAVDAKEEDVRADPAIEDHAGIWAWNLKDESSVHILKNKYFRLDGDIGEKRTFTDPIWSPDGTGIIFTANYWEGLDVLWLDPVVPDLEGDKLKDPFEFYWVDASWTLDGGSILVSGRLNASTGGLYKVDRQTLEVEQLIDGEAEELYIALAYELPDGIAFLDITHSTEPQLYLGSITGRGFDFAPVDPEGYIDIGRGWITMDWDPDGRFALISGHRRRRLISLDGSLDIDLAPYLRGLAQDESLKFYWGAIIDG